MAGQADERLTVGLVRGLHGLRGAVRVEVLTDEPTRFEVGSVLFPEGATTPLTVAWVQRDGPGLLVRFEERGDREAAEDLRDRYLEAPARAPLPAGSFYWHELVGVTVSTTAGEVLGRVDDVFRAGGGEVLIVRSPSRGEVLVPTVSAVVTELAPRDGRIVVDAEALDLGEPAHPRPRGRRTTRACRGHQPAAPPRGADDDRPDPDVLPPDPFDS